jgi:hypothetical protein
MQSPPLLCHSQMMNADVSDIIISYEAIAVDSVYERCLSAQHSSKFSRTATSRSSCPGLQPRSSTQRTSANVSVPVCPINRRRDST